MLFNILQYSPLNFLFCFIFSFFSCFFGTKYFINFLKKHKKFQPIRIDGPLNHLISKSKTPTMGGLVITLSLLFSILFFCNLKSIYILILIFIMLSFSLIGFLDDFIKVVFKNVMGFRGSKKLILQLLTTSVAIFFLVYYDVNYFNSGVFLPIFNIEIPLCSFILVFYIFTIVGSSNATNITDGLDGLLSMPIIFVSGTFVIMIFAMIKGYNYNISLDYNLLYNLLIVLLSIIAVFSAFLVFNCYPAEIIMGDVGSLMIGAVLCYISILLKIEILFGIMSLLFVWEILSTILQSICLLLTKEEKRIFKMAPFHHHLEKSGWSEKKIVFSMWCFSFVCCIISLIIFFIK